MPQPRRPPFSRNNSARPAGGGRSRLPVTNPPCKGLPLNPYALDADGSWDGRDSNFVAAELGNHNIHRRLADRFVALVHTRPVGHVPLPANVHKPDIGRNFEVLSPCDFIARITQHIPDKSFQLVRYYGWYSNKMRGQRLKRADAEAGVPPEGEVIEVSEPKPRRIPSKKWRELIKKIWEADPLRCPHCQHEMRVVALIDEADVIERILRHLGLGSATFRL